MALTMVTRTRLCRVVAWLAAASLPIPLVAAEVYASYGMDGSMRYATQAIDPTYRPLVREPESVGAGAPEGVGAHAKGHGQPPEAVKAMIDRVAQRHGMSVGLVRAVAGVESNFSPAARSHAGARGVMQLMPSTARRYGVIGYQALHDPERNIDAGVRHLKELLGQYEGNVALALAAYNAGSGAVARHRNRIPPYRDTMLYVPAVLARMAADPVR